MLNSQSPKHLIFMGSDPIALPVLKWLRSEATDLVKIVAVVTQPDRKTGRGMKLKPNKIKAWAQAEGLPVIQPTRIDAATESELKSLGCDLILVMAYGQILKESLLNLTPFPVLNLHASLLPKLRGASPIHTAIATGEKQSGVSLMQIVRKLDAGAVADQEIISIKPDWKSSDLTKAISEACIPLVKRNLKIWTENKLQFTDQDESLVTYCRIITKQDAELDFRLPAPQLANRILAFQPWPGTQFQHKGTSIKIIEATAISKDPKVPGLLEVTDNKFIHIHCAEGILDVTKLQKPGKTPLFAEEFLRGFQFDEGIILPFFDLQPLTHLAHFKPKLPDS